MKLSTKIWKKEKIFKLLDGYLVIIGRDRFFEPISKAYGGDIEASSKIFGLIVWVVFMERKEQWGFGKYEVNGVPIKSITYFKIRD